ncbi:glycosyltransferase family 2 protein [Polynucleobacter sp. UK-Gri1-W3]|uniref:glycosyltransferase family 2 protein n=1 Tax=Polynucleobacter sp. UK-Gri1-W3 TaxID=1819737 RepID=UPI001C0C727B|nr:glycosyltransferase family 2 protein [Polynucleobacter sp. UK-Gri1-W3]
MNNLGDAKVGIVTVLYNSEDVLEGFFRSLSEQNFTNYILYVIDNSAKNSGSLKSLQLSKQYGINCEVIFNNANLGVAEGNNQGIELALLNGCTHVLLANNDTEFGAEVVGTLLSDLKVCGDMVVTPKIRFYEPSEHIWYAGGHINSWLMRTPHKGYKEKDQCQFDSQITVNYAPTCFMMLDIKVFDIVGKMDEKYFVYLDDTDFVWRMGKKNIAIKFNAKSIVYHKVSHSTGGEYSPFAMYYSTRNMIYFARKNLYGLHKIFTLTWIVISRLLKSIILEKKLSDSINSGLKDGFNLKIN